MAINLKPVVTDADNIQGNPNALITLVEYGDYQCPFCSRAYPIVKKLQAEFGSKLKFVFRNLPLEEIHSLAFTAAIAAEAAAIQGKFWEMHDIIFENQSDLHDNSFKLFAKRIGLNIEQFNSDITAPEVVNKVEDDFECGIMSGVNGTPTFFINGRIYDKNWDLAQFSAALTDVLS